MLQHQMDNSDEDTNKQCREDKARKNVRPRAKTGKISLAVFVALHTYSSR